MSMDRFFVIVVRHRFKQQQKQPKQLLLVCSGRNLVDMIGSEGSTAVSHRPSKRFFLVVYDPTRRTSGSVALEVHNGAHCELNPQNLPCLRFETSEHDLRAEPAAEENEKVKKKKTTTMTITTRRSFGGPGSENLAAFFFFFFFFFRPRRHSRPYLPPSPSTSNPPSPF